MIFLKSFLGKIRKRNKKEEILRMFREKNREHAKIIFGFTLKNKNFGV